MPTRAAPSGPIMRRQVRLHSPAAKWYWCHKCKTASYSSRSDARIARKSKPSERLAVLQCPHTEQTRFHLVTRPLHDDGGDSDEPTGTREMASASTGTGQATR